MIISTINILYGLIFLLQVPRLLITFRLPISSTTESTPSIAPIATSFQTIMDHINSLKSPESITPSESQLTPRSTYPTHKSTYPYVYHTIKKTILPSSALELANSSESNNFNKYYAFPESPSYSDLSYRQTTPEMGMDLSPGIGGSTFNPIASYASSIPMSASFMGQPSFASPAQMFKPIALYNYAGGDSGYGGGGHDSGHSSGHSYGHGQGYGYQHHYPKNEHHGHHAVQYIPIPVSVGHQEKSSHHKHDLTTLLAAIAIAAGLPLLLGALLLPLGVLFLLNLATLIAVLATGLGGATNGTRSGGPALARGRRSIGDNNFSFDFDNEFMTIFHNLILDSIYNWIESSFP
ncbi:uncharacterized protein LOC128387603 [Panonychus citri]|uniref:uncharacterized protein LOC128387603 n=1 Tax=Panonychus citri TaxID=50023 RepID=UPI002307CBE4|nr:uncharacterized protein LOC128387603 [Panonychus citri]